MESQIFPTHPAAANIASTPSDGKHDSEIAGKAKAVLNKAKLKAKKLKDKIKQVASGNKDEEKHTQQEFERGTDSDDEEETSDEIDNAGRDQIQDQQLRSIGALGEPQRDGSEVEIHGQKVHPSQAMGEPILDEDASSLKVNTSSSASPGSWTLSERSDAPVSPYKSPGPPDALQAVPTQYRNYAADRDTIVVDGSDPTSSDEGGCARDVVINDSGVDDSTKDPVEHDCKNRTCLDVDPIGSPEVINLCADEERQESQQNSRTITSNVNEVFPDDLVKPNPDFENVSPTSGKIGILNDEDNAKPVLDAEIIARQGYASRASVSPLVNEPIPDSEDSNVEIPDTEEVVREKHSVAQATDQLVEEPANQAMPEVDELDDKNENSSARRPASAISDELTKSSSLETDDSNDGDRKDRLVVQPVPEAAELREEEPVNGAPDGAGVDSSVTVGTSPTSSWQDDSENSAQNNGLPSMMDKDNYAIETVAAPATTNISESQSYVDKSQGGDDAADIAGVIHNVEKIDQDDELPKSAEERSAVDNSVDDGEDYYDPGPLENNLTEYHPEDKTNTASFTDYATETLQALKAKAASKLGYGTIEAPETISGEAVGNDGSNSDDNKSSYIQQFMDSTATARGYVASMVGYGNKDSATQQEAAMQDDNKIFSSNGNA